MCVFIARVVGVGVEEGVVCNPEGIVFLKKRMLMCGMEVFVVFVPLRDWRKVSVLILNGISSRQRNIISAEICGLIYVCYI